MTGHGVLPAPVGLVLAGGESRRLGSDKARLEGATLTLGAVERLAAVCAEVAVADRGRELVPGRLSLAEGAGRGPVAGILGGAAGYPGRSLLVLACDLPRVPTGLLAELARSAAIDWVVPRWAGGLEPLCAFYGPAALAALAARVREGRFSLHDLAGDAGLAVRYLEGEALRRFGDPGEIFFNLNTPGDLERWREAKGT
jgi:molybdopterin-guanine dinucleotide biosynthesis protein A